MNFGEPAAGEWRERLLVRREEIAGELEYWREHVASRQAEGVKIWSKADFAKGDYVHFRRKWYEVLRVNAKSVTIPAMINGGRIVSAATNAMSWTDTVPYHEVSGRKSAEEMAYRISLPPKAARHDRPSLLVGPTSSATRSGRCRGHFPTAWPR